MLNSNKRSITINTKTRKGQEVFRKLIKACDVMVENFAPGALDRHGFHLGSNSADSIRA